MRKYDDCYDKFNDDGYEYDRKHKCDDDDDDNDRKRKKPYKVCYECWRRRCYYYDKRDRKDYYRD